MNHPPYRTMILLLTMVLLTASGYLFAGGHQEQENTPPSAAKETISIIDQTGREVSVPKEVRRIVTIPIPAASMLIAIDGGTERLVGMHPKSKSALEEGILKEFYPEALRINSEVVGDGFMPNVEAMLALNPDLIFQWGHLGVDVVEPLENAGLNVALLLYGSQENLEGWIHDFGLLLDKEEKAQKIIAWHHEVQEEIGSAVAEIPENEKPRVLYFLRWLSSKTVAAQGTYNDFYINLTGGINPAGELTQFPQVSEEQIIAWDPQIILLNGFESELTPQDIYGNPKLADVSAVRDHRVYKIPLGGYRWDPPNQESPLMWKWLAMLFHPERFGWDLRNEIKENYLWIYGKVPTEEQIDGILRKTMNSEAAGYDRFLQ
ncbi:ABC transporter substrate-binding protein [Sediminispirochaeta smaragdinae]|uniref:Periplasmic binding protein n=1 Tax=Sediminispirochaeta smaragdinae (strain DSM 11293 / JCM 15392 / SEBR 4228) TaxID=573413 RepID=E1R8Q8_SEDSS|nr:ABC transporter substrate-binding protein [Sediminispirochaeta smaragdinae]ADK81815.1 periplasmic binding protein [Sediminispirochaeta smaragdinae DSM 11293]